MRPEDIWSCLFVASVINIVTSSVIPKVQHNTRPVDKSLSDENHFEGEDKSQHNLEYDHDAFLGKEEAKSFDELSPDESRRRLGIIFQKIDKDQDGLVTDTELQEWIRHVQRKYVETETDRQWTEHMASLHAGPASELRWPDYLKRTYGSAEEHAPEDVGLAFRGDPEFEDDGNKVPISRDKRRWDLADVDKNGRLTKEEFMYFLHPEEADHMKDIVVELGNHRDQFLPLLLLQETLEDTDKDKDGFISLQEYMDDTIGSEEEEESDPEWIAEEEEDFHEELDKDKDGKLNREEIAQWVIPNDYDHSLEETRHLFTEADSDNDGFLTKSEVVEKYDLFVGSQATDYGEVLAKHDEF